MMAYIKNDNYHYFFIIKDFFIRKILSYFLEQRNYILNNCIISQSVDKLQIYLNFYPQKYKLFFRRRERLIKKLIVPRLRLYRRLKGFSDNLFFQKFKGACEGYLRVVAKYQMRAIKMYRLFFHIKDFNIHFSNFPEEFRKLLNIAQYKIAQKKNKKRNFHFTKSYLYSLKKKKVVQFKFNFNINLSKPNSL